MASASSSGTRRWDGTQVGFELDADAVLAEITDDLLYHGDLNAALRRMMQSGLPRPQRRAHPGHARDAREAAPQAPRRARAVRPRRRLRRHRPGAARRRRHGARGPRRAGPARRGESGDARRQEITDEVVQERNMQLDMLPPDLAGQVQELQEYEFTSTEAREKFEELMDQLRQQLMQSYFNQMSGAMQNVSARGHAADEGHARRAQRPARAARARARTRSRRSRSSCSATATSSRRTRRTLDELLEVDGPAHGGHAGDAELDDARAAGAAAGPVRAAARGHGPALADGPARRRTCSSCSRRWAGTGSYDFSGQDPLGFAEAAAADERARRHRPARELLRRRDAAPARWPRSTSTGPASCSATTPPAASSGWPSWPRCSRRPASSNNKEGRYELTPHGHPQDRPQRALRPVPEAGPGQARPPRARAHRRRPRARVRDQALRVRRPVQPRHRAHGPQRHPAARAAARRCGSRPTTSRSSGPSTSSGRAPC